MCMCSARSGVAVLAGRGELSARVLSRASACSLSAWAALGAQAGEAAPGNAGAIVMGARHTGKLFLMSGMKLEKLGACYDPRQDTVLRAFVRLIAQSAASAEGEESA